MAHHKEERGALERKKGVHSCGRKGCTRTEERGALVDGIFKYRNTLSHTRGSNLSHEEVPLVILPEHRIPAPAAPLRVNIPEATKQKSD